MKRVATYIFLFLIGCAFSNTATAQMTGADTVCAGYMYTYTSNIPGAVTYTWTIPSNWYDLQGQGTSQIIATCNVNGGQVCAEGFDSTGTSLGTQCMNTGLGAASGGGGNWHIYPSGSNAVCDDAFPVSVTPIIIFDGGGGGGCFNGCDVAGIRHPNIVFALYSGPLFCGVMGTSMSLGWGTFNVLYVDTTLGSNLPQARQITDGACGGSGNGTFTINSIALMPWVSQSPTQVCIGDTVTLTGNGIDMSAGPSWAVNSGLTAISSVWNIGQLQAIVTGLNASVGFAQFYNITDGFYFGTCGEGMTYNLHVLDCGISAGFQSADTSICGNNCISFTNASAHASSWQWSFPGAVPSSDTAVNPVGICYSNPGSYDVQLIVSNPVGIDTLLLTNYINVYPNPPVQSITQSGDTLFAVAGAAAYQWYYNGGLISGATDYFYLATLDGDYNMIATDSNGCEVEAVIFNVLTPVQTLNAGGQLSIFPNPVENRFTVKVPGDPETELSIYNIIGEKVLSLPGFSVLPAASIDVSNLPPGIYFLDLQCSHQVLRAKLVKR